MRNLAFLMALVLLCASLCAPAAAASPGFAPSSSGSSSANSSSAPSEVGSIPDTAIDSGVKEPTKENTYSHAIYMLNIDSGDEVFQKAYQDKIWPASLTKIMTAIVVLENVGDIDKESTSLTPEINNYISSISGATTGDIYIGEIYTIHELLYAMMLQSANEAAMMVASYVGKGDLDAFYDLMNEKAKELGAVNTHFSNATGLHDPENYSTAYDLALISKYAMENETFVDLVTTTAYSVTPENPVKKHTNPDQPLTWFTRNQMMLPGSPEYYYEGIRGVKTGALPHDEVGDGGINNFISTCTRNGYTYLCVCIGAPQRNMESGGALYEKNLAYVDTKNLYDWAFKSFTVKTLMDVGDQVAEVPVRLSWDTDNVKLLAGEKFARLVRNEVTQDNLQKVLVVDDYVDAPIKKGDKIGVAKLMLNGEQVGQVDLLAADNVMRSDALYYLDKIKQFFNRFIFKFILTFVIVLVILYIILMIIRNHNRRRYKMRRRGGRGGTGKKF